MGTTKPDRRNFLRRGLSGVAAAGVAGAIALPASAQAPRMRMRPGKKVIYKPGEEPSPTRILSSGIQFGRLLFVSGQGAHDPMLLLPARVVTYVSKNGPGSLFLWRD